MRGSFLPLGLLFPLLAACGSSKIEEAETAPPEAASTDVAAIEPAPAPAAVDRGAPWRA